MKIGSLFSGYGGLDMAVEAITGATPAWFCEWDEAPSKILNHHWPHVPNLSDITQVDWSQVEPVDIITGGSPCQDLSAAGRRAGMVEGTRSNLWVNMREAIAVIKPRLVVWENVRGALSASATSDSDLEHRSGLLGGGDGHLRALGRVLGDLTDLGYDTEWEVVRASDVGAPHHRARVFLIAYPQEISYPEGCGRDHGQAPDDGQTNREVNAPRNDCDDPAYPECDDGGPWSGVNSRREAPLRTPTASGSEYGSGTENENTPHPANNGHERAWSSWEGGHGSSDCHNRDVEWGEYAPAVRRWERIVGPAPAPTEPNSKGKPRLNAAFAEWMMGLPSGHVTAPDIGLSRADQLKAIGNGVCPQQASFALSSLLEDRSHLWPEVM